MGIVSKLAVLMILVSGIAYADVCTVYFTGIGCPFCAKSDPYLLTEATEKYNLTIIEYEIYQESQNANLLLAYNKRYNPGYKIPVLIFSADLSLKGSNHIINDLEGVVSTIKNNPCPLINSSAKFSELNISALPGKPKIWHKGIFIEPGNRTMPSEIRTFIETGQLNFQKTSTQPVAISGDAVRFENAGKIDGWLVQWDTKEPKPTNDWIMPAAVLTLIIIIAIIIAIKKYRGR